MSLASSPSSPPRVAAIIPAFDAAASVAAVVSAAIRAFSGLGVVYVVDDGSTDGTAEAAQAAGAVVLTHATNMGKGAAMRSGFQRAWADGHVAAVTLDADGQHSAADARKLAEQPDLHALVLGIRDLKRAGAPRPNRMSNAISNGFLSLFSGRRLLDTQCGLRRYPLPRVLEIGGRDVGYAFEAEIILLAIGAGVPLVQVPITALYPPDRTTHFDSVRDPMRVIRRVLGTLASTRFMTRPSAASVPTESRPLATTLATTDPLAGAGPQAPSL